jgi:hypothetical protein
MKGLPTLVAALLGITLVACVSPPAIAPSPTGISATERPVDLADANGCRVTAPTTTEHPRDPNTAAFSRAWFVSADRMLWASATGRLYAGENKMLWERPGPAVSLSGRLWGDTSGLAPTITPSRGYETTSYQASGVTFRAAGCWEVVARAASSELRFIVFVYPETYSGAARRCQDLADIYSQSDAVVLATSASERPDTTFAGFTWYTLSVSRSWKGSISAGGAFELLTDADAEPRITPTMRYVLFLARDTGRPWRIICPFRSVAIDDASRQLARPSDHQLGSWIITQTDFDSLDARLRELAK